MKIEKAKIVGLYQSQTDISVTFHDDLNIITGKNGSGKTTVLKLLWYCISANIERAIKEIEFSFVEIITSKYFLSIGKRPTKNNNFQVEVLLKDLNQKEGVLEPRTHSHIKTDRVLSLHLDLWCKGQRQTHNPFILNFWKLKYFKS